MISYILSCKCDGGKKRFFSYFYLFKENISASVSKVRNAEGLPAVSEAKGFLWSWKSIYWKCLENCLAKQKLYWPMRVGIALTLVLTSG